jgi:anti-sigma regulatory factor (Ser/Thr protein kinase)
MTVSGLDLHLSADVGSVRTARHAVRDHLTGRVDEETRMNAELLVSELVTNGIQHGPGGTTWIDVRLRTDAGGITIEVVDGGAGFDPEDVPEPDPILAGGWGLTLVERIADRWGTRRKRDGTAVWVRFDRMLAPHTF